MRKFLLLFGLIFIGSFDTSANNIDALKKEKSNEQIPLIRCYQLKVQKEILNNWIRVGPTTLIVHNKLTTETGALAWSEEINEMYNNDYTFNFSTGTGTLYTIQVYPDVVSWDKCGL